MVPRFLQWLHDVIQDLMFALCILLLSMYWRYLLLQCKMDVTIPKVMSSHGGVPSEKKEMGEMERKGLLLEPSIILSGRKLSPSTPPAGFSSHLIELNWFTWSSSSHHWQSGRGLCLASKPTMSQPLQLDIMLPNSEDSASKDEWEQLLGSATWFSFPLTRDWLASGWGTADELIP